MRNTDARPVLPKGSRSFDLRTVSHTLHAPLAEQLRTFAFETRISESAVLEYALSAFLASADDEVLAATLREAGYGLRRKTA